MPPTATLLNALVRMASCDMRLTTYGTSSELVGPCKLLRPFPMGRRPRMKNDLFVPYDTAHNH